VPSSGSSGEEIGRVTPCRPSSKPSKRRHAPIQLDRNVAVLITCLVTIISSFLPLVVFTTTAAYACACGCSVFDVGGLDLPQEQDHGGRVFFEFWSADQTQNYVGSSKAPASLNTDKQINTQWWRRLGGAAAAGGRRRGERTIMWPAAAPAALDRISHGVGFATTPIATALNWGMAR
jgi:hypothetical protein